MTIDAFHGFTLAILLLFVGKGLVARWGILRRYSIPESLVGGLACALVVFALYYGAGIVVSFDLEARDALLLYFFAAIGLGTDARTLRHGGRPLLILSGLAIGFMVLQNLAGMEMARAFGLDPRAGLMVGSISLTGGVGTTLAWSDHFVQNLGIAQAQELGLAANMIGLIAACTIGGPIASCSCAGIGFKPLGTAPWKLARCTAMSSMPAWTTTACCWHCSGSTSP
jgi:ESS family glutamate:Na+ symporter